MFYSYPQAQAKSSFRQEASRLRALAEPRVAALRQELEELRVTISAEMKAASGQLRTLGAVVSGNLGAAVSIARELDLPGAAGGSDSGTVASAAAVVISNRQQAAGSAAGVAAASGGDVGGGAVGGTVQAASAGTSAEVLRLVEAERAAVATQLRALVLRADGNPAGDVAVAPPLSAAAAVEGGVSSLMDSVRRLHVSTLVECRCSFAFQVHIRS